MYLKYSLLLLLSFLFTLPSQGALIDFHFGDTAQTGAAVLGTAGDYWNSSNATNGGPVALQTSADAASGASISWTSNDSWAATTTIHSNAKSTPMNVATEGLMSSFASSYQYKAGSNTNLTLSITGLAKSQAYTLVLYGAGDQVHEGTAFTVAGTGTFTGNTSGLNREVSDGAGDAYIKLAVISSAQGTLKVTTQENGYNFAILNGFQLDEAAVAVAPTRTIKWGICGHPTWADYADWTPANDTTAMNYLKQLGCTDYRCSFEGADYPSILATVIPPAKAAGVTIMPILPLTLTPSATAATNYTANYKTAYSWATYAIAKGYAVPYWELGNELENDGLVSVVYDGASPNDFPDEQPGAFVAIASGLNGAYHGLKDAYTAGRTSGLTTLTPQVLYGATYRHWGLLTKIQTYLGSLPCDILSWHWYGPNYGAFNLPISDSNSVSNKLTPAQCLNAFKSKTDPSEPMDIWITENNRSQNMGGGVLLNGSTGSNTNPAGVQDWTAEATAIQANVDSFKAEPTVKAIFVYELLDEPKADGDSTEMLASQGYFGLVTKLNGVLKPAFYTYQAEIQAGP
jgi:hypothetical protein